MPVKILHVDAFTAEPYAGNPACVCLLPEPRADKWLQNVAREMNLSETAFLVPQAGEFALRWFTPAVEVELCGHATLASAHVLWEEGLLEPSETARFHTLSGLLTATLDKGRIELNFPAKPEEAADPPPDLLKALGVNPVYTGKNAFDYVLELDNESEVRSVAPDFALLRSVPVRGVVVTARSKSPGFDFVSRFFGPAVGVDEDPVTGSAHCCLAPFWQKRLGKSQFCAFQASARGGVVHVRIEGDRVILGGRAVTILRGELLA